MTSERQPSNAHSPRVSATIVATLANDLRNVLTVMTASIAAIRRVVPPDPDVDHALSDMDNAIEAGFHLADEMVATLRTPHTGSPVAELNDVVSRGHHAIARLVGEHVRIGFNLTPMNPIVRAAVIEVEWLILNLASNARDAMPDGGELTIETDLVRVPTGTIDGANGRRLPFGRLTVTDTGGGMNAQVRARATEPFFSTKSGAFGLGLTSAALTVRRLGGFLRVARTGHHGTSLEAYLPAQDPRQDPRGDAQGSRAPEPG
jgi:signal transduction histidine kinase